MKYDISRIFVFSILFSSKSVDKFLLKCYYILCKDRGDILDFIVTFFRDILDGPIYIIVVILNSILICSCIGYLGERYLNNKKKKESYINVNGVNVQNSEYNSPINVSSIDNNIK